MIEILGKTDRDSALRGLPEWQISSDGDAISREVRFSNFSEAFGFMTRVALIAEKLDHHPDWSNSYNRVRLELSTHSAGGITEKDIAFAKAVNGLLGG